MQRSIHNFPIQVIRRAGDCISFPCGRVMTSLIFTPWVTFHKHQSGTRARVWQHILGSYLLMPTRPAICIPWCLYLSHVGGTIHHTPPVQCMKQVVAITFTDHGSSWLVEVHRMRLFASCCRPKMVASPYFPKRVLTAACLPWSPGLAVTSLSSYDNAHRTRPRQVTVIVSVGLVCHAVGCQGRNTHAT
jgi:hypothetical protein